LQELEVEKIISTLPGTIPGDVTNVNNCSAGVATVNQRGWCSQRTLILMEASQIVPFNFNGQVDTATIATALVELNKSQTSVSDGDRDNISLILGSNLADDKGKIAVSLSWMNRDQILLGDLPLE
jgi:hypothetical protein